jgi:hypothetical protein
VVCDGTLAVTSGFPEADGWVGFPLLQADKAVTLITVINTSKANATSGLLFFLILFFIDNCPFKVK